MRIALVFFFAFSLQLAFASAQETSISYNVTIPCSRINETVPQWLNSSTQASKFDGNFLTVYALMPNNKPYLKSFVALKFTDIAELGLMPTLNNRSTKCAVNVDSVEQARNQDLLKNHLDPSQCQCNMLAGSKMLGPNVSAKFISVSMTRPDWPDFKLVNEISLSNDTFKITNPPAASNNYTEYDFVWNPQFPKWTMRVSNFNWTAVPRESALRIFFKVKALAEQDTFLFQDNSVVPFTRINYTTERVETKIELLRAFKADGEDYLLTLQPEPIIPIPIMGELEAEIDMGVVACVQYQPTLTQYKELEYDPSLQTLFIGDSVLDPVSPNAPPSVKKRNEKSKLHPAAYAVPIAIVIAAFIIFIIIAFTVPAVGLKVMPSSFHDKRLRDRDARSPTSAQEQTHTRTETTMAQNNTNETDAPKSEWRKSHRPPTSELA